jgi:hypothetical protein
MDEMRQATPEQKAAATERRAKVKQMCATIAALPESDRIALSNQCLATNTQGHTLSPHNQMLIAYQFASATVVGGFHQWKAAGRSVKKGEHCISIWVPIGAKDSKTATEPTDTTERPGFMMGAIFDISQTEPLTEGAK